MECTIPVTSKFNTRFTIDALLIANIEQDTHADPQVQCCIDRINSFRSALVNSIGKLPAFLSDNKGAMIDPLMTSAMTRAINLYHSWTHDIPNARKAQVDKFKQPLASLIYTPFHPVPKFDKIVQFVKDYCNLSYRALHSKGLHNIPPGIAAHTPAQGLPVQGLQTVDRGQPRARRLKGNQSELFWA